VDELLVIEGGAMFAQVLADLDRAGYTVAWTVRGACLHGACHCRHRIFLAATTVEVDPPGGALFGLPLAQAGKWPPAGFVQDGVLWEMPAKVCGKPWFPLLPTPTARDADRGAGRGDKPGRPLSEVVCHFRDFTGTRFEPAVRRHEKASGRAAPSPVAAQPNRLGNPHQSAEFPEWMQDLPVGWVSSLVDRESALRLVGNGVNPRQGADALAVLPTFRAAKAALTREGARAA
jgi:hypothetical protein